MSELVLIGLVNCCLIWGIHCAFNEGFFLYGFGQILERSFGTTICKPIFLCPPCQSSLWGAIFFISAQGLSWVILPYCVCLCGLNFIIKEYLYG